MDTIGIKRIITLYDIYREKVESILDICPIVDIARILEIAPLQIAIAVQIFRSVGIDPQPLIEASLNWADHFSRDFTYVRTVKRRLELYEQVAGGHRLRGNWVFGLVKDLDDNPILRCLVAFGDLLLTPACGDDYDNAPMERHDIMPVIEFARRTMTDIIAAYDDFRDEVTQIALAIRSEAARPFNLRETLGSALQFRTDRGLLNFLNSEIDRADGADRAAIDKILNLEGRAARARVEELLARGPEPRDLLPAVSKEAPDWTALDREVRDAAIRYEQAAQGRPDSAGGFCDLGCACLAAGRYFRAREAFLQALARASDDRRALGNLAYAQHRLLDDAGAAETLKRYLALYDDAGARQLWETCEKNARRQEARAEAHPRGLPQGIDIEEAMGALRDAGEDVDGMNDREILMLYELRFRSDSARTEAGG